MSMEQDDEKVKFSKYEMSHSFLSADRIIFLKEDITKDTAAELSALFLYYDNLSQEDISLYIHCRGGDADSLINIYDVMQMIKSPIKTICIGKAYSAAAVLLAAGSDGKRFAFRNSSIMIHGIQCAFPIPGHDQVNSKNYLQFLNKNNDNIMKVLSKHTRKPLNLVKNDCKRDLFLNPSRAVAYGIIDHII